MPVPGGRLGPGAIDQVHRAFDEAYAQRHGSASSGEAVEETVAALGTGPRLALPKIPARGGLETGRKDRRPVYFPERGGDVDRPVYGRDQLSPGVELVGPAVIEERESTTVRPPGCGARVDEYGRLLAAVAAAQ